MSIRKNDIDKNRTGILAEKQIETVKLIGVHVSTRCEKSVRKDHNKVMCFIGKYYGYFTYDDMDRDLGFGMQYLMIKDIVKHIL